LIGDGSGEENGWGSGVDNGRADGADIDSSVVSAILTKKGKVFSA